MAKVSIVIGVLLTILGLYAYVGLASESITALIPAFFGLPLIVLGIISFNEKFRKHSMHIAIVVATTGFIGAAIRVIPAIFKGDITNSQAFTVQVFMAMLCLIYVVLAVQSFIKARKNR